MDFVNKQNKKQQLQNHTFNIITNYNDSTVLKSVSETILISTLKVIASNLTNCQSKKQFSMVISLQEIKRVMQALQTKYSDCTTIKVNKTHLCDHET